MTVKANEKRALELLKRGEIAEAAIAAASKRVRLVWHSTTRSDHASSIAAASIAEHFGLRKSDYIDYYVYVECTRDEWGEPIAIIRPGGQRETD